MNLAEKQPSFKYMKQGALQHTNQSNDQHLPPAKAIRKHTLKGNVQFVQKVTFEPLMDFKQNHYMEVENITKAATFNSSLHLSYKNTQLLFL